MKVCSLIIIMFFSCFSSYSMDNADTANQETPQDFQKRLEAQKELNEFTAGRFRAVYNPFYSTLTSHNGATFFVEDNYMYRGLLVKQGEQESFLIKNKKSLWFDQRTWVAFKESMGWGESFLEDNQGFFGFKSSENKRFILACASLNGSRIGFIDSMYLVDSVDMSITPFLKKNMPGDRCCNAAVSNDGTKVALSGGAVVYLAIKKLQGGWSKFSLFKKLKESNDEKTENAQWRIYKIDFNTQGNLLGVNGWCVEIEAASVKKRDEHTYLLEAENI